MPESGVTVPGLIGRDGIVEMAPNPPSARRPAVAGRPGNPTAAAGRGHAGRIRACVWPEQDCGAAAGCSDFAVIDISSGLGMGVMCDRRYIRGAAGLGGELGHITVKADGPLCGLWQSRLP